MIQILLIIQIVVTILMIVTILLQRNTSDGLGGMGGGNMPTVSTDSAGPLAKLTGWLGAVFLINCLAMAAITSRGNSVEDDIMQELGTNARIPVQTSEPTDAAPEVIVPDEAQTPAVAPVVTEDAPQAAEPAGENTEAPVVAPVVIPAAPAEDAVAPAPNLPSDAVETAPAQQ